jgi:hypothetical protein
VAAHGAQEGEGRVEVVLVVLERDLATLSPTALSPAKWTTASKGSVGEQPLGLVAVGEVEGVDGQVAAR